MFKDYGISPDPFLWVLALHTMFILIIQKFPVEQLH